jgi:hypothetical protein
LALAFAFALGSVLALATAFLRLATISAHYG